MSVSPDDRFAGLINSSAERGGWVPGDVFGSDSEGEEEPVEPRRVRLPILVALAVATAAVLVIAFLILRPAPQHAASEEEAGSAEGSGIDSGTGTGTGSGTGSGAGPAATTPGTSPVQDQQAETEATSAAQSTASGTVVVHVTGAVHRPSVVRLSGGARVQDAVEEAGGLKEQADAEAINLARVLQDGEQIHIPARGEAPGPGGADSDGAASAPAGGAGADGGADSAAGGAGSAAADPNPGAKVDLNTADLTTLETLPGVGPVTAEAIIAHREEQPFTSIEDLLLVQGIGPKTFESLKDRVSVG